MVDPQKIDICPSQVSEGNVKSGARCHAAIGTGYRVAAGVRPNRAEEAWRDLQLGGFGVNSKIEQAKASPIHAEQAPAMARYLGFLKGLKMRRLPTALNIESERGEISHFHLVPELFRELSWEGRLDLDRVRSEHEHVQNFPG